MAKKLTDLVRELRLLLNEKTKLETQTKINSAAIEAQKREIIQQMIDDDTPSITVGDFTYTLQSKTAYSKISDSDLIAAGVDYLKTLRAEGFGDLIRETVNPKTLQGAMASYVCEHGKLTDGLLTIIRPYDYNDIFCRTAQPRKRRKP